MSAVLTQGEFPNSWRQPMAALALALAALLLLYRDTFGAMVTLWARSDTFAHAFLVPPIALWLAWRRRHNLEHIVARPQPWFLLPMLAMATLWLLGDMAGVNAATHLAATALLVLLVPAVLGSAVARELAFPLGFLFFMVPIGEFAMPTLMEWTANFTVAALQLTGVPVFREGLNFTIPSGSWSVIEACSGVRYLIASLTVGTLFAYLNYRSTTRRLIFCGVAILVPVLANWGRAYMIVMIGHLSNNELATGVDHLVYGWLFFGVLILLMFVIGSWWSETEDTSGPPANVLPADVRTPSRRVGAQWLWAAAVVLVAALPQAWHMQSDPPSANVRLTLPDLLGVGTPTGSAGEPFLTPVFTGASAAAWRVYGNGETGVTVHVAYYRQQGYGHKLVSSDNVLLRSKDPRWNQTAVGERELEVGMQRVRFNTAEVLEVGALSHEGRRRLDVLQIYWVDGQLTQSDHWAVVLGVLGRMSGRNDDAAAITIYTEGTARSGTTERLNQFTGQHLPTIQSYLASTRSAR